MPFTELAAIDYQRTPLDLWGGWDGEGVGPSQALYLTTGARQGGTSHVLRLDPGATLWVDDGAPEGAETLNKIRNGLDPESGLDRLYAFFESPNPGQTWIISKSVDDVGTGWSFEGVPVVGSVVGGRGLAINGAAGGRVLGGSSRNWATTKNGQAYEKAADGSWGSFREPGPSLCWELEFDALGRLWEFYTAFSASLTQSTYMNGSLVTNPPTNDVSHVAWFLASMYAIGDLSGPTDRNVLYVTGDDGSTWGTAHTLEVAVFGDHVVHIPRGVDGELWVTGCNPFEIAY